MKTGAVQITKAQNLTMETLPLVRGGIVAEQFDALIRGVVRDCHDRPALAKPRKIVLEVSVVPLCDDKGNIDVVEAEFAMKSSIPGYKVGGDRLLPRGEDSLFFQPMSPTDPRQEALPGIATDPDETIDPETGEAK